jgi:hypothetical protein
MVGSNRTTSGKADLPSFQQDVLYYGFFSIGSPAQNLSIEIDTGSADMWLATSKCNDCTASSSNSQYSSKKFYRSSSSSTSQERRDSFHVGYGSGGVCGSMVSDKMEISGFKVDSQDFGGVFKQSKTFQTSPNSGLLGEFHLYLALTRHHCDSHPRTCLRYYCHLKEASFLRKPIREETSHLPLFRHLSYEGQNHWLGTLSRMCEHFKVGRKSVLGGDYFQSKLDIIPGLS